MFRTIDLTPHIGTEVQADREILMGGSRAKDIRRLLEQRGVLIFRQLNLTGAEQLTFTSTLGEVADQSGTKMLKISLDKEVMKERAYLAEYFKGTFFWHIDKSADDIPTLATLLSGRRLSETGGQTEFANTYAAWEELPETDKEAIAKLKVVHTIEASQRYVNPEPTYAELKTWQDRYKPKTHPLVWTHRSGRKSLVLGATAARVADMNIEEGNLLLCRLREWATQARFVYRHEWTLGDLVIWDNTGTMHRALPYPFDSGRVMHRTVLEGEEPIA
jgi:alpha-ketoglutarate-dependent taurine dioxygenase